MRRALGVLALLAACPAPEAAVAPRPSAVHRAAAGEQPMRGYRAETKEGDFVLRGGRTVATVSAKTGRLLDFGLADAQDELVSIEPTVAIDGKGASLDFERADATSDGITTRWRVVGRRLVVHVNYTFRGDALQMSTSVTSEGDAANVAIGESISWGNVPSWVAGHGPIGVAGDFTGEFVARDALGVAYALMGGDATKIHFPAPSPGFWAWPRTREDVGAIDPATPQGRTAWLAYGASIGEAAMALPRFAGAKRYAVPAFDVEVRRCNGGPFATFHASLALPPGCFEARLIAPGREPTPWSPPSALPSAPRAGTLAVDVTEGGAAIPARVVIRGIAPTPDPSWGDDPIDGAVLNVAYARKDFPLPPGRYTITASRGPAYTIGEREVTIEDGKRSSLAFALERVVDTRGWRSADLHVHAAPSPDAPTRLADRVRSLAAAGVEVAVATDHNAVTDYAPTIRDLGMQQWLASIVGDEVTTRGALFGHFNVFPLTSTTPLPYENTTPHAIVLAARPALVQLNHPRMGDIGYFDILKFDPKDVAGWRTKPNAELGFDAIELFNGDHYDHIDEVEKCLRDWYALLDAGVRITATGNSDSHKLAYHEAGVPWNYVRSANDADFFDAIRAGRVVVTSGPMIRLTVNGRGLGEHVPAGDAEIAVRVDAPPWVDVDRVDLVGRGGAVIRSWPVTSSSVVRIDERYKTKLARGDYVVALARGSKAMGHLHRAGAKPFAFTNPIFVD